MTVRYVLAPQAAQDLVDIWHYIKGQGSEVLADRVESVILDRILFLSRSRTLASRSYRSGCEVLLGVLVLDRLSASNRPTAGRFGPAWQARRRRNSAEAEVSGAVDRDGIRAAGPPLWITDATKVGQPQTLRFACKIREQRSQLAYLLPTRSCADGRDT